MSSATFERANFPTRPRPDLPSQLPTIFQLFAASIFGQPVKVSQPVRPVRSRSLAAGRAADLRRTSAPITEGHPVPVFRSPANRAAWFPKGFPMFQKIAVLDDSLSGNYQILSKTIQNSRFAVRHVKTQCQSKITHENSRKLTIFNGAPRPDLPRLFSRSRIFYLTCANGK